MEKKTQMLPVWNGRVFKKPRLPKTLAWVVGVEGLSVRFTDVPQFENIQVWFDDHPVKGDWFVTASKAASEQIPQQVLTVWYSSRADAKWYFMVYPVEAKRRSHVRELLQQQAFPVVEEWMKKERPDTWFQNDKHLRCIWHPETDHIEMKEELR
jgi:hypothetical protein